MCESRKRRATRDRLLKLTAPTRSLPRPFRTRGLKQNQAGRVVYSSRQPESVEAVAVLSVTLHLFLQALLYRYPYRPDEGKALDYFIGSWTPDRSLDAEILTRFALFGISSLILLGLSQARLVNSWTIAIAFAWPMTAFLFSKIYWEFFVFPLCLIKTDISRRSELTLIASIAAAWIVTGEGNLVILGGWRLVLLLQKTGLRAFSVAMPILIGIAVDRLLASSGASVIPLFGDELARFSWTRNIVNPEYSLFETVGVFFASMHFFSLHTGAYWVDIAFSTLTLLAIGWRNDVWLLVRERGWELAGFGALVFAVTNITHAFQNARYYYFFIPLLASITPKNRYGPLVVIGLAHISVRAFWL